MLKLPDGAIALDNSMLDKFRACPRAYFFRFVRGWTPAEASHDLIFGNCWHTAMDVVWINAKLPISDNDLVLVAMAGFMDTWYKHYPLEKDATDSLFTDDKEDERFPKTPGRARDMLAHYIRKRRSIIAAYEIIGVETPFIVPLPEFDNTFYIGRKDKTYRVEGKGVIDADHKTSKTDGQKWADTFFPNSQMDGYIYAGHMTYGDEYWGVEIDGALVQKGSPKSAREDYPLGIGFMSIPIQRTLGFVSSWLWDTQLLIKQIEAHSNMLKECRPEDEYLRAFEKHTTGCGYYRGCEYRNLCKFYPNPLSFGTEVPRGYIIQEWNPLDNLDIMKQVGDDTDAG